MIAIRTAAHVRGVALGLVLLLSACARAADVDSAATTELQYGAIVDAGSTGSRVAIYEWRASGDALPHVWPVAFEPGACPLATFASAPGGDTCACLQRTAARAVAQAHDFLGPRLPVMPLWVKATAGVREAERRQPGSQETIVSATRRCLASAPGYALKDVSVISGADEAAYAWIAVNYLAGTLRRADADRSIGIVDLGGQSAQIAFRVAAPSAPLTAGQDERIIAMPFAGAPIYVYAISFARVGQVAAMTATRARESTACADDVAPDECRRHLDWFLCRSDPPARVGCPNLARSMDPDPAMQFVGLSAFAYAVRNAGLGDDATLWHVRERAEAICGPAVSGLPRAMLRDVIFATGGPRRPSCFEVLYAPYLVERGWGLDPKRVAYPKLSRAIDPSWTLGAMIIEAARRSP